MPPQARRNFGNRDADLVTLLSEAFTCLMIQLRKQTLMMDALLTIGADWKVLRRSANASALLGITGERIGQPAKTIFPADFLHDVRGRLQIAIGTGIVERLFDCRLAAL